MRLLGTVSRRTGVRRERVTDSPRETRRSQHAHQLPRALDIARPFREAGIPVIIGGFHVSGGLAMHPEVEASLQQALSMQALLRSSSTTPNRVNGAGRFGLLALQVMLTVVLLYGTGLFLKSFRAVSTLDPGFEPERVVVAQLDPQAGRSAAIQKSSKPRSQSPRRFLEIGA